MTRRVWVHLEGGTAPDRSSVAQPFRSLLTRWRRVRVQRLGHACRLLRRCCAAHVPSAHAGWQHCNETAWLHRSLRGNGRSSTGGRCNHAGVKEACPRALHPNAGAVAYAHDVPLSETSSYDSRPALPVYLTDVPRRLRAEHVSTDRVCRRIRNREIWR